MSDPKQSGNGNQADKPVIPVRRQGAGAPETQLGGAVDLPIWGHLAVEVTFLGEPVEGLYVEFERKSGGRVLPVLGGGEPADSPGFGAKVKALLGLGDEKTKLEYTDAEGRYVIPYPVAVGIYKCKIEHQDPCDVTTVEDPEHPYSIVLPVGRPYFDSYEEELPESSSGQPAQKEKS